MEGRPMSEQPLADTEQKPDECITCGATPQSHGSDCWECPECGLTGCGIGGCEPESDRPFATGTEEREQ
jgi:ribosomal protein L37AE/L43A